MVVAGCYEAFQNTPLPVQRENVQSLTNMVNKREQLAEAVLNHALEIICLLTVEDFIVVKRPHDRTRCTFSIRATEINSNGSPSACPELFFTLQGMEDKTLKIIVELANKILWLLTREVPVKCEDVDVFFSEGECDGLEGHEEQYKNNQDTCTFEQPTALVQQSTENNDHMKCCIKEEPDEEPHHVTEFILNTPERQIPLLTVNDHIPAQTASGSSFIFSSDNQPESGEGSFENTINSLDAESPQFFSPERDQVYKIIDHIKKEPEESQELYISASGDTISPADRDEDYLPPKTNHKRTRKGKSRSGKTSPPCEVCGKVFGSKSSLDRHFQIHTGQRPFPCNKCGKRFSCRNHLTTHERTHSGERPFPCNQCGRRFINHQHLVLHQVTHTGEKPFSCPVCGKGFTRQSSVVKHSGMHAEQKPFVCKECGKSYCQYANLVVHQRLHSGEKPFVCKYCEKAFICKATMLRHQMAHTGEKPFPCPQCNKCFIDNSTLSKHKRRVHNKEPKPA